MRRMRKWENIRKSCGGAQWCWHASPSQCAPLRLGTPIGFRQVCKTTRCVCLDSLDTLRGSVFVHYSIPPSLLIARPTTALPYLRAPLGSGWDGSGSRLINRGLSGGDWCLRMCGGNWNYGLHREGVDDAMDLVHMCVTLRAHIHSMCMHIFLDQKSTCPCLV